MIRLVLGLLLVGVKARERAFWSVSLQFRLLPWTEVVLRRLGVWATASLPIPCSRLRLAWMCASRGRVRANDAFCPPLTLAWCEGPARASFVLAGLTIGEVLVSQALSCQLSCAACEILASSSALRFCTHLCSLSRLFYLGFIHF